MWRELVESRSDEAELNAPAGEDDLAGVERTVNQPLPADLRSFLLESNGVSDEYGTELVWPTATIIRTNVEFRQNPSFAELYQPFDDLLFFGENGGGDQFAVRPDSGSGAIYVWNHETDERTQIAERLEDFLIRSLEADGEDWYREA